MVAVPQTVLFERSPLWTLLHPRGQARELAAALLAGAVWGWLAMWRMGLPGWVGPALTLTLLALPLALKWRADRRLLGTPAMVFSVLLITQGLHTVEHLAQWAQHHLLGWPAKAAGGLISPLNAEIVHFTWNLAVLAVVIYLLGAGQRSLWMWLLLVWATAHTAEHTYLFARYLAAVQELRAVGLPLAGAQGLPGILGNNGWLATQAATSPEARFICTALPGLASASRLDVHFGWNAGELVLLLAAAQAARLPRRGQG